MLHLAQKVEKTSEGVLLHSILSFQRHQFLISFSYILLHDVLLANIFYLFVYNKAHFQEAYRKVGTLEWAT